MSVPEASFLLRRRRVEVDDDVYVSIGGKKVVAKSSFKAEKDHI